MDFKIGFIGTGNMGGALATAVGSAVGGNRIMLADKMREKAFELSKKLLAGFSDAKSVASVCKYIFLGVKPQMIADTAEELLPYLRARGDRFILVSMAAGVSTEKLAGCFGNVPIIRIMPNTAVEYGEGMVLYAPNALVTEEEEGEFLEFMKNTGALDKIPESLIDAGSALSGCGPAFVYMFIEALADGGVRCGLSRASSLRYAEQTLIGAAKLAKESGRHPEELKDAVCSPAGSTIEGCIALENGGFRASVANAVTAAFERTKALGK